jgi:hypothetical protein
MTITEQLLQLGAIAYASAIAFGLVVLLVSRRKE